MNQQSQSHRLLTNGFSDMLDYIWDIPNAFDKKLIFADLVILGQTYKEKKHQKHQKEQEENSINSLEDNRNADDETYVHCDVNSNDNISDLNTDDLGNANNTPLDNIKSLINKFTNVGHDLAHIEDFIAIEYPEDFLNDLKTKLWFSYRFGFPLIERDRNGPMPLSLGSLLRGNLDISNINKGFTSDSGWGCMIRTSQSLLANALIILKLGRNWRLANSSADDINKHWEVVEKFADVPEAQFSIHNYVLYAAKYCGKKPGEWFGPSNAAKSIQKLCNEQNSFNDLKVYLSSDSGDIFEDEVFKLSMSNESEEFTPILFLCGVRLGVHNINSVYWEFLKLCLQIPYSVGIAGGRPSSSHYFLGFQSDYLFYFDPHTPQAAILLDNFGKFDETSKCQIFDTIHTTKIRRLHLDKIDPSMLIGFLIKNKQSYEDFKSKIMSFDAERRFLNIFDSRPFIKSFNSAGSELDGFIDLGFDVDGEEEEEKFDAEFFRSKRTRASREKSFVLDLDEDNENKTNDLDIDIVKVEKQNELTDYEKLEAIPIDDSLVQIEANDIIPIEPNTDDSHLLPSSVEPSDNVKNSDLQIKESLVLIKESNSSETEIVSEEIFDTNQ
jgi:cysteine protease ATG4